MDLLPKNYKRPVGQVKGQIRGRAQIKPTKGFGIPALKKQAPSFLSSKKVMTIPLIILIISLVLWAGFLLYQKNLEGKIVKIQDEIKILEEERDPEIIEQISAFEKGISILKGIIEEHTQPKKIFALLEENTLPQVAWSSFALDTEEGKISLNGRARSYTYVAKQIIAFEDSSFNQVAVSGLDLSKEGGIGFSMEIGFQPKILK